MATKRLRAARPSASPKARPKPVNLFDRPPPPQKLAPGHYDGDGCTFPEPSHFQPRSTS